MTKTEIAQLLSVVSATYPSFRIENKQLALDIWHSMFAEHSYQEVMLALKKYIKTNKSQFAPSIAELFDLLDTADVVDESIAWSIVAKAITRSGYYSQEEFDKLPLDVQKAVGTPAQLREWALTNNLNMSVESSNFYKRLATVREREKKSRIMGENNGMRLETMNAAGIEQQHD